MERAFPTRKRRVHAELGTQRVGERNFFFSDFRARVPAHSAQATKHTKKCTLQCCGAPPQNLQFSHPGQPPGHKIHHNAAEIMGDPDMQSGSQRRELQKLACGRSNAHTVLTNGPKRDFRSLKTAKITKAKTPPEKCQTSHKLFLVKNMKNSKIREIYTFLRKNTLKSQNTRNIHVSTQKHAKIAKYVKYTRFYAKTR